MKYAGKGFFLSFEGIEGCGKSTHAALFKEWLEGNKVPVLLSREPGGTVISEGIRRILLDPQNTSMDHRTELLLYLASRSQVVRERIKPALDRGMIVLVDRYVDSTLAYQGYGRGLDMEDIRRMNAFASRGLVPDLTFLLDLDPDVGFSRKEKAGETATKRDRIEREGPSFHRKIREGFLSIAAGDPGRIVIVRSDREIDKVQQEIRGLFTGRFGD
jgi:dTMP kinase